MLPKNMPTAIKTELRSVSLRLLVLARPSRLPLMVRFVTYISP